LWLFAEAVHGALCNALHYDWAALVDDIDNYFLRLDWEVRTRRHCSHWSWKNLRLQPLHWLKLVTGGTSIYIDSV